MRPVEARANGHEDRDERSKRNSGGNGGAASGGAVAAYTKEAVYEIYPRGEDHTDVRIPCAFSQRQGYVTIARSGGVTHALSPVGDAPGHFTDQAGSAVYRQRGL